MKNGNLMHESWLPMKTIGVENFLSNSLLLIAHFFIPATQGSLDFIPGSHPPMIKLAMVF